MTGLPAWHPPGFTGSLRGHGGTAPLGRWEAVLDAERSPGFELIRLVGRVPGLRWLSGGRELSMTSPHSLEERERRVAVARRSPLGRLLRLRAGSDHAGVEEGGDGPPRPGPLLDTEIDDGLALLADVPFEELQERGWQLHPNHYYWPLNDVPFLRRNTKLWRGARMPPGIRFEVEEQLELVRRLSEYASELEDVPAWDDRQPGRFAWNPAFSSTDAYLYYCLVRHLKPRRVVEVGVGWSSLLLIRAVEANGGDAEVTLIEPEPPHGLLPPLPAGWELRKSALQAVELEVFDRLESGDVLFYDGSHCVVTGGDVNWMLFRVLPRLKPGVWIHFHDIFWPMGYPPDWILNEGLSWNEQYVLQAFLMHNFAYAVRAVMRMLYHLHDEEMHDLMPPPHGGVSVWIEKTGE